MKKISALRMEGCTGVKIIGGQYIVEHDGTLEASAIDISESTSVEMVDVVAKVINQQQQNVLQDIELLLNQHRTTHDVVNQKIDVVINAINDIRNADQSNISTKVSDLIIKLASLSELGVNVIELIQNISSVF